LAAALSATIAIALLTGWYVLAAALEAFLMAAVGAILFGGFCFGSFTFHLLTGNVRFAMRTLPWGSGVGGRGRGAPCGGDRSLRPSVTCALRSVDVPDAQVTPDAAAPRS
jgi:hypothetical protein